jgi:hypothetical protein
MRSVKQIEEFLKLTVCASESTINRKVFGYDRNTSRNSNVGYATLLRRGLKKGLYNKFESKFNGIRSTVFYYKGTVEEMNDMLLKDHSGFFDFVIANEGQK